MVNVVTEDGSDEKYHGTLNVYTDRFGIDVYDQKTFEGVVSLGGPVPLIDGLTFMVYGERKASDGYLYGYNYPNWSDSKGLDIDPVSKLPAGEPTEVSMDKSEYSNASAKLKWQLASTIKLSAFVGYSEFKGIITSIAIDTSKLGCLIMISEDLLVNLNFTHTLSSSTYYTLTFGSQSRDRFLGSFEDLAKYDVNTERSDPNNFVYSGENWQHQTEESGVKSIKAVFVSQVK
ncbi:MAG: hypothetical protein U5K00_16150 [Melioribacteraceae bacterium]|nr:hypothetical protein [Melioribacteraceae bacterium]